MSEAIGQSIRYVLIGALAILMHYSILYFLIAANVFEMASAASTVGFISSIPINFLGQRYFVFKSGFADIGGQFGVYCLGLVISLGVNASIVFFLTDISLFPLTVSQLTATASAFAANFFYNKFVTFR